MFTDTELRRFSVKSDWVGDCLIWNAAKDRCGYGWFFFRGQKQRAHRLAYSDAWGDIPNGLVVRHTCDNPACINPSHLVLGTDADNARDKALRNRSAVKVTARQVRDIRSDVRTCKQVASTHGISISMVSLIKTGKRRQYVGG